MGYIYKITNTVNGKIYIGQTSRSIELRWKEHKRASKYEGKRAHKNQILYYAMRKYGLDAFNIEKIEECNTNVIDEREQFWISHYDSTNTGYNISIGGNGYFKVSNEKLLSLWESGMQATEIAKAIGFANETVSRRLNAIGITHKDIHQRKLLKQKNFKVIHKYDISGNFIESVPTDEAIKKYFGHDIPNKLVGKTIGGFQWRYSKYMKISPIVKQEIIGSRNTNNAPIKVYQYTMDGKYVGSFVSANKAATVLNVKSSASIRQSCKGKIRYAYGYRWSYEKVECLPPIERDKTLHRVAVIDENGNMCKVYESIKATAEAYGLTSHTIEMVCNGTYEKAKNTRFVYYDKAS